MQGDYSGGAMATEACRPSYSEFPRSPTAHDGSIPNGFLMEAALILQYFLGQTSVKVGPDAGTFLGKTLSIMVGGGAYSPTADCEQRAEERNTKKQISKEYT